MNLLRIARVPPVTVEPDATVRDAVNTMTREGAGAIVVVGPDSLLGIFTTGDLLKRVVVRGLTLERTPLSDVMTAPCLVARWDTPQGDALSLMTKRHVRHLPIVDGGGRVRGMLSRRHLLGSMVDSLTQEVTALDAYHSADGIGG
jgi:CBS domain-containing protein